MRAGGSFRMRAGAEHTRPTTSGGRRASWMCDARLFVIKSFDVFRNRHHYHTALRVPRMRPLPLRMSPVKSRTWRVRGQICSGNLPKRVSECLPTLVSCSVRSWKCHRAACTGTRTTRQRCPGLLRRLLAPVAPISSVASFHGDAEPHPTPRCRPQVPAPAAQASARALSVRSPRQG